MEGRVVGRGRPSERVSLLHRGLAGVLISGVVRRVRHAPDAIRQSWAHCDDSDCSKPSVLILLLCGLLFRGLGLFPCVVGCLPMGILSGSQVVAEAHGVVRALVLVCMLALLADCLVGCLEVREREKQGMCSLKWPCTPK